MASPKRTILIAVTVIIAVLAAGFWGTGFIKARAASRLLNEAINSASQKDCGGALEKLNQASGLDKSIGLKRGFDAMDRCFWQTNLPSAERIGLLSDSAQNLGEENRAVNLIVQSSVYYDSADCRSARVTAEEAAQLDPQNPKAVAAVGASYFCDKNYASAREWYQKALELNPNDAAILNSLGAAFALDTNRATAPADHIARARDLFLKAISINPNFWKPYFSLAYYSSGSEGRDYAKTLEYIDGFRRAYAISEGWPPAQNANVTLFYVESLAGDSYAALARTAEAKIAYGKMLEVGNSSGIIQSPEKFGIGKDGLQSRVNRANKFLATH